MMITYSQFLDQAAIRLSQLYDESGRKVQVVKQTVTKLKTEESYEGLSIISGDPMESPLAPTVNLTNQYLDVEAGKITFDTAIRNLYEYLQELDMPQFDPKELMSYDGIKDKLILQLIDRKDLKEGMPYMPFGETLAVIFRIQITDSATSLINSDLLDKYGVTVEQLFADAIEAARTHSRTPVIRTIAEMLHIPEDEDVLGPRMYVVTTPGADSYGAGAITIPGFLEEAAERIGGDYWILPSSYHELILYPAKPGVTADELQEMVIQINREQVDPSDRLSDDVYYYDVEKKRLTTPTA